MDMGILCLPTFNSLKGIQVTAFLIVCSITLSQGASIQCSQPSNQTLQQQHSQLSTHSGILLPSMDVNTISSDFVTHIHPYGDMTCPSTPASGPDDTVESRSLCPWYYVINHDPTRYPTSLAEARCRCTHCIGNNINQCEPIHYGVQVLQQTDKCENGYYVYEPKWLELSVGCTCAMPKIAVADPIDEEFAPEI